MTVYMVMGICDDEYGCTEVLGVFDTKEKAETEKAKLVKEAIKDEEVDEKGKIYPWYNDEEGVDFYTIEKWEVK